MVDAQTWQDEVVAASSGDWPRDGWYRLVPRERSVDVRSVTPADHSLVPTDAELPDDTDSALVQAGYVAVTCLAGVGATDEVPVAAAIASSLAAGPVRAGEG